MTLHVLLVLHIAVLGYWLGSEFVINSTFRLVSRASSMPFEERNHLMDHVMDADQHVRYALVLQFTLGFALAVLFGYLPGGETAAWLIMVFGAAWITLVEVTHRSHKSATGERLAAIDRAIRYLLMASLFGLAIWAWTGNLAMPGWLALKLASFACVMACGVGIRFSLMAWFRTWSEIAEHRSSPQREERVQRAYAQSTAILGALWVFIILATVLSVWKPF